MPSPKLLYLCLDLATLSCPLLVSLISPNGYFTHAKAILLAVVGSALPFIAWDYYFTIEGHWSFSEVYCGLIHVGVLPIEEVLFFVAIPFATLFLYHLVSTSSLALKVTASRSAQHVPLLLLVAGSLQLLVSIIYHHQSYTAIALRASGALMILLRTQPWATKWCLTYIVHLAPFLLINGILTALPVVSYNEGSITGYRIGTIPVEDFVYSAALLLLQVHLFEYVRSHTRPRPLTS